MMEDIKKQVFQDFYNELKKAPFLVFFTLSMFVYKNNDLLNNNTFLVLYLLFGLFAWNGAKVFSLFIGRIFYSFIKKINYKIYNSYLFIEGLIRLKSHNDWQIVEKIINFNKVKNGASLFYVPLIEQHSYNYIDAGTRDEWYLYPYVSKNKDYDLEVNYFLDFNLMEVRAIGEPLIIEHMSGSIIVTKFRIITPWYWKILINRVLKNKEKQLKEIKEIDDEI